MIAYTKIARTRAASPTECLAARPTCFDTSSRCTSIIVIARSETVTAKAAMASRGMIIWLSTYETTMERIFHDGRSAMAEALVSSTARSALHDLDYFYVRSMRPQPAVPVADGYGA